MTAHLWSREWCVQNLNWAQWREFQAQTEEYDASKPYYRPMCNYRTASWDALGAHWGHCGKSEDEIMAEHMKGEAFCCPKCERKSFATQGAMEAHAAVCGKTEEEVAAEYAEYYMQTKPFPCSKCKHKSFATKEAREAHEASCGKSEAEVQAEYKQWKPFVCHCGKRFMYEAGKGGLDNHKAACY